MYEVCASLIHRETVEKEEVHVICISQRVAGGGIAADGSIMEWAFEGEPNRKICRKTDKAFAVGETERRLR